eukprot:3272101-Amphidinium_carterae.1
MRFAKSVASERLHESLSGLDCPPGHEFGGESATHRSHSTAHLRSKVTATRCSHCSGAAEPHPPAKPHEIEAA